MNRKLPTYSRAVFYARLTLAVVLLAAFVCTAVPLASVSAGNVCHLECCAGRAPHTAGSCMNGTCHAAIRLRQRADRSRFKSEPTEKLCGLNSFKARTFGPTIVPQRPQQNSPASSLEASMLVRPCQPDCGAATLTSVSQRRPRETAALSFANRTRPPSALSSLTTQTTFAHPRQPLRSQASPRAPPILNLNFI